MSRFAARFLVTAAPLLAAWAVSTAGAGDTVVLRDRSFEDFIQGEPGNSGANVFVSRSGRVQAINRLDFNNDGYIDLLVNNKHNFHWAPDALIYWGRHEGFRSLTPPLWQTQSLFHLLSHLDSIGKSVTRLPAFGGGRSRVLDLNKDGYLDLIFVNFLHSEKTEMEAYVYWGGAGGFDVNRRALIPTLLATGFDAGDFNGDGYTDLVFSNFGEELGEVFGLKNHLESWVYWGNSIRYDARRRSRLPTVSAVDCAAADLNGDGKTDLVFLNKNSKENSAYVYWGNGRDFSPERRTIFHPDDPKSVTVADLDKDGKADLIITSAGSGTSIYFGSAAGVEAKPRLVLPSESANQALVADLNRDGALDLAVANSRGSASFVYWGGSEGFNAGRRAELPTLQAWGVAAGELNGDQWPDLVFANSGSAESADINSYIYWGSPSGYLPEHRAELQTFGAVSTQVADLDGDGLNDVVFINQSSGRADEAVDSYLFWGNPAHYYSASSMTRVPTVSADESSAADLNDDSYPDLVVSNPIRDVPLYIYWGGKTPYSSARRTSIPLPDVYGSSVADLNRDGYLDLLLSVGPKGVAGMGLASQGLLKDHGYASILWGGPKGYSIDRRQDLAITPVFPFSNVIADLNKDGYLDLLFPDRNGDRVQIVWGAKNGYDVKRSTHLPANSTPSLEVADLNGDGWLDVIFPNGQDWKTQTRHTRTYIYPGGPEGFSAERRMEVESISAHEAAVADYNLDGHLDVAITSYQGDEHRNVPTFIFWGGPDGTYSDARRSTLPSHSGCGLVSGDFNQDGYPDLFQWNHIKDGDHAVGSWIFWGAKEGFGTNRRTWLPSSGPHYSMGVDLGNLYDRKPEEYFTSRPHRIPEGYWPARLAWKSKNPPRTGVKLQLRTAATEAALRQAAWSGPKGASSFYESAAAIPAVPGDHRWAQYRIVFTGLGAGNSAVVEAVELECRRGARTE
jgi:hypothetical protein